MAKEERQASAQSKSNPSIATVNHQDDLSSPLSTTVSSARTSLQKLSAGKRAKRLRFFVNGDRFFKGVTYAFSTERTRTFDALLQDLNRLFANNINLTMGVRNIFAIDGSEKITSLNQLQEGFSCNYVCASNDNFIKLNYSCHPTKSGVVNGTNNNRNNIRKSLNDTNNCSQQTSSISSSSSSTSPTHKTADFIRPKLVAVIRNGIKPRKSIRILLNKKTAQTYEQVLSEITKRIQLDCGSVRKLFTINGKQVTCLADFFNDEDVFIAYGLEKFSSEDLDLDNEECRYINSKASSRRAFQQLKPSKGISSHSYKTGFINGRCQKSASSNVLNGTYNNGNSISLLFPKEVIRHYEIGHIIGDGNFAVVHECLHKATQKKFAMKIIDKNKCKGKEPLIVSEVAILRRSKHCNIVQLIEDYDYPNELYLVMELVTGGDLFDAIILANRYTERDASKMIYDLANALAYLHSLKIVHRDIKPENLLIYEHTDGTKSLKLADFGLAIEMVEDRIYEVCGTPTYVAPEILAEAGYGLKVDVWAAGVITYILLCGFPPFANEDNDQDELFDQILSGQFEFKKPFWDDVSEPAKELILHMLKADPEERFTARQVIEHPWISGDIASNNNIILSISNKLNVHFDKNVNSKNIKLGKSSDVSLVALNSS